MILVDTHVVLWLLSDPARLSKAARAAIEDARRNGGGLAICGITLLEIATANLNGRISLTVSLESFLKDVEERFVLLPISARACARTLSFPAGYPKDPADRVIGATALVEGISLVTADREIRRAKVAKTIW